MKENSVDHKTFHIETGTWIVQIKHPATGKCESQKFTGFQEIKAPTLKEAIALVLPQACVMCGATYIVE